MGTRSPLTIDDVGGGIDDMLAAVKGPLQGTVLFTDVGMEHIAAACFAQCVTAACRSR